MCDTEDYLTSYREFFESFAVTVNPEDQLPVHVAGYTITEAELSGEILLWTTQYLTEKNCPKTLLTPLRRIILNEVLTASKKQPSDFGFRAEDSVYIALRLMQAVAAKINDICLRYLDNAQLDALPPPPEHRERRTTSAALKNSRRVMEDRHVDIGNLEALFGLETTEPTSFYAVYDGHAGSAAAVYCAAHLHQYLVESPHFKTDLRQALKEAFLKTDAEFVRKSNQERANGGSTAVVVVIRGNTLHAAWAGDSQALLAKRMRLLQLVQPHKPSRQDEKDRIEASGGTVMFWGTWRVNGQLAVSRAIGDAPYKPYVTAKPEIATVDLDGDEDFVVVACDGLWDFVSEDQVALAVYYQIAANPDDLGAVTKRLLVQAKQQSSVDNISVIVVFLKETRQIVSDNCLPMDVGQNNVMASAPPPFPIPIEAESCKRQLDISGCDDPADNGLDNSDSDSEDLGPETAVDVDDLDADKNQQQVPTSPANGDHAEEGQIDGVLADNVAESGEESEDEWNYFKGDKEQAEDQNPSEEPEELPRSETPCQDNSAWESSSVDMNSSPLNPDAPVFIPGTVAGSDVLLAESPRKPLPMDDIELPADVDQFETEAVIRPKDLLDLDNCDQLNGHHNISLEDAANLNGNEKSLDSLGFGLNVGDDPDKPTDSLIQDFNRIQKDTTDFCNIQVIQSHLENNPFSTDADEALLERLKNKERDPMSMSFYQDKDDDSCTRLASKSSVDLNAVQTLPDTNEDDDSETNGDYDNQSDKENISLHSDLKGSTNDEPEPNNDNVSEDRMDLQENNDNFSVKDTDYNINATDLQNLVNINFGNRCEEPLLQTDTPESHKLLFEQIPEIPDGKNSELGFTDDLPSENENRAFSPQDETSHDVEMESKQDDSPLIDTVPEIHLDQKEESPIPSPEPVQQIEEDKDSGVTTDDAQGFEMDQELEPSTKEPVTESPEPSNLEDFGVDMKQEFSLPEKVLQDLEASESKIKSDFDMDVPVVSQSQFRDEEVSQSPFRGEEVSQSPFRDEAISSPIPAPSEDLIPSSPTDRLEPSATVQANSIISESPIPEPALSPLPSEVRLTPVPSESPLPLDVRTSELPRESPLPTKSPLPTEILPRDHPAPSEIQSVSSRLSPEQESVPAPDIVPEEVPPTSEPVTDLDIGIAESRAQEICVPVTSEIQDEATRSPADVALVSEDIAAPETETPAVAVAAAGVLAAVAVGTAVAAKAKSPVKKAATPVSKTATKTTPKVTPVSKAPLSATKKPTSTTPAKPSAARTTPAKTTPKPSALSRPATAPAARPAAAAAAAAKPAPKPAAPTKPASRAPVSFREPVPKPAPASAASRPASAARPAPAMKRATSAPRPALPRTTAAPRPAAPRVPLSKTKESEKKPLTNGETKVSAAIKKTAMTPVPPSVAAARPAPRPAPRPAADAAASTKSITSAAPRPAPRFTAPGARSLDKPLKELANKRTNITTAAKTAPSRTAATKAPAKPNTMKPVPKKPIEKKAEEMNGLTNGKSAPSPTKLPPSPNVDSALLPDVIA